MKNNIIVTPEQKEIIEKLRDNNVIVEAVAGSGKTTTSLLIAEHFAKLNVLLLTYNARLKMETRKKQNLWGLENLEVHTIHSFGFNYYNEKKCSTDKGLNNIIDEKKKPILSYNFDLIILDEAQDITPLYYEFICKIISDNKTIAKLCVLGDRNQSIYLYNKADYRYLNLADQCFNFNQKNWLKCSLSETFRINDNIVNFINKIFYQKDVIRTNKKSDFWPEYIFTNAFNYSEFYNIIKEQIEKNGIENIFVLAPSVTNPNTPIRMLANWLSNEGIKIFIPGSDDEKINEKDINGKLVFSTFHQVKGLERKLVIVFGFDASYFEYYSKHDEQTIAPNPLYVAITRASEKLILVHHYGNDFLPFLKKEDIEKYCNKRDLSNSNQWNFYINKQKEPVVPKDTISIGVTQLIRHISQNIINDCMKLITCSELKSEIDFTSVDFASHVKEEGYEERVSMITGTAVPLYFEIICRLSLEHTDTFKVILNLLRYQKDFVKKEFPDLLHYEQIIYSMKEEKEISIENILLLANLWIYIVDKFNFRLNQITKYDWTTKEKLKKFSWFNGKIWIGYNNLDHNYIDF